MWAKQPAQETNGNGSQNWKTMKAPAALTLWMELNWSRYKSGITIFLSEMNIITVTRRQHWESKVKWRDHKLKFNQVQMSVWIVNLFFGIPRARSLSLAYTPTRQIRLQKPHSSQIEIDLISNLICRFCSPSVNYRMTENNTKKYKALLAAK